MKKWDELPDSIRLEEVRPYYEELQKHRISLCIKRIFDFVFSIILILLLSPVFLILMPLIGLTSAGGVFFCQTRVTTYGKTFRIFKFRTMIDGAEQIGSQVTTNADARVTKVGRFLRKVRLDELPQLFNIVKGEMSFVGTRPEVEKYVKYYRNEMMATLLLPAGVTSQASIVYKDEERLLASGEDADSTYINVVLPEKMKYNLEYVKRFSFWTDIKLIIKTIGAVLS